MMVCCLIGNGQKSRSSTREKVKIPGLVHEWGKQTTALLKKSPIKVRLVFSPNVLSYPDVFVFFTFNCCAQVHLIMFASKTSRGLPELLHMLGQVAQQHEKDVLTLFMDARKNAKVMGVFKIKVATLPVCPRLGTESDRDTMRVVLL